MAGRTPLWRRYLVFWGRDVDRDLDDEVTLHLDARTEELVEEGWTVAAARDEARRLFGDESAIRAECHRIDTRFEKEQRMARYLDELTRDVRFALRQLRRQPRFWAVIVLTLVVGIAASTSLFAVVDGVMLKPLPYADPDRLVALGTWNFRGELVYLRERGRTMDLAAYYPERREVTVNVGGEPARLPAAGVSDRFFDVLGVPPVLGRGFTADEMRTGSPGISGGTFWRTYGIVILSDTVWQTYFDGRADVIGRTLSVEDVPHTVVGVMPPEFNFPSVDTALWFPHHIDPSKPNDLWAGNVATMVGRLRDGRTVDDARQEVQALIPTFRELIPWGRFLEKYGADVDVRPLADDVIGDAQPVLLALLAAIGVLLLVLCVNVANLLLARGVARGRELGTRAALGAARPRLIRQLLVENVVVAVVAGALGTVVTIVSLRGLVAFLPPDLPRLDQIEMDARVLLFALGVSVATGLVFGVLPAMRATRRGRGLLGAGARGGVAEAGEGRLTGVLGALEFSCAVVLVVAAALLLRSLWNLTAVDPGFKVEQLVTARVAPPGFNERSPLARTLFARNLRGRLSAAQGVQAAGLASTIPFDRGLFGTVFTVEGRTTQDSDPTVGSMHFGIGPTYLETMGIPVLQGRGFTGADRIDAPRVALVSRSLAHSLWGDDSPLGVRVRIQHEGQGRDENGDLPWITIVGVVGDVRFTDLASESAQILYLPLEQLWELESLRVVVRTPDGLPRAAMSLRGVVAELDPATPVSDVRTFEARLGDTVARPRFAAYLLGGFAGLAMLLAAIGVYGVLSYAMSRRIPEIGVRVAFGASDRDVFRLLFGYGLRLALIGIMVGIPVAVAATRLLESLLFGVDPLDASVFAAVAGGLLLVGAVVSYVPARRATRIDPLVALRQD